MSRNWIETIYDIQIARPSFLGGDSWNLKGLTPIAVVFGKNGSGKSILLRRIRDNDPEFKFRLYSNLNVIPSGSFANNA